MIRYFRTLENDSVEECYYVETATPLTTEEDRRLRWLLSDYGRGVTSESKLQGPITEIGPRLNFETAFSSTAKAITNAVGAGKTLHLEKSRRIRKDDSTAPHYDRMTEMVYPEPLTSFGQPPPPQPIEIIDALGLDWRENLQAFSKSRGLGWDDQDLEFERWLYQDIEKRNPTDVELFSNGQANSDHSRHGRFNGIWVIDGQAKSVTLMKLIKRTLESSNRNCIIAFHDNSSAIRGKETSVLSLKDPLGPSRYVYAVRLIHPTLTAETHNHPTMIEPYQGMATLVAVIRDQETPGRGGRIGLLGIGIAVGNHRIPGYIMPWEEDGWNSHPTIATPLQIGTRGSQGAFDFGNAFGQPTTYGSYRTFGMTSPDGIYRSWYKPIAYGVAVGSIDDAHVRKSEAKPGMLVALVGGPGYRIGVGGGSGSSMLGGENQAGLDFNSVQRGDPEMQNRVDHFMRGCIELADDNPLKIAHDLGAGGVCNAGPEAVNPAGALIDQNKIPSGDASLSALEIAGNEAQERNIIVFEERDEQVVQTIARRESAPLAVIGKITGDGRYKVIDGNRKVVDLPLEESLGNLPPKTFSDKRLEPVLKPLVLPPGLTVGAALDRVLRLPAVASKQWLTRRVDRSVTGLIAQQQCIGPNHLPLSDYTVKADSYIELSGTAYSLGEQPNIGLVSPACMVRMAVTEALLNLVGAKISALADIKGSTNWMLPVKLPGMGAWLYDAMEALVEFMAQLRIAAHGGKDSMSLAGMGISPEGKPTLVPGPGQFVYAPHANMPDIRHKVTPYINHPDTMLLYIDLGNGKNRLGGSSLAQVYSQIGNDAPDVEDPHLLVRTFDAVQKLVEDNLINSAHDRSDGGLVTTLLEMGFASNLGMEVWLDSDQELIPALFSQEAGLVLGCLSSKVEGTLDVLRGLDVPVVNLGRTKKKLEFKTYSGTKESYAEDILHLRSIWEETGYRLDKELLRDPQCTEAERRNTIYLTSPPPYRVTFRPPTFPYVQTRKPPKVAILRNKGSNGEKEMAAYFQAAGFEAIDVHMNDLLSGDFSLSDFRGVALVGGFSDRDVFGAGKGWAGVIRFNQLVREEFEKFRARPDTFGLGICNGCQVMGLLDWVPGRFVQNKSRMFESRFVTTEILESDIMFFKDMAGSRLGVWLAHGEGKLETDSDTLKQILEQGLAPVRYVGPEADPTEEYPFNPNGSAAGIAGLASHDKRFFAMMPHAERTGQMWNWPWAPEEFQNFTSSPWFKMFTNAREWCEQ